MSTPQLKRSRSSLSQSTLASPSPAGTSSSSSQSHSHPHPLRQTVFARDISGRGGVREEEDDDEGDDEDDGEWRRREGDDEFEDVTRAGARREGREGGGEEEEEEDGDEDEEEEEEGGSGYFPSLSIKIKPPVAPANYKRPAEEMGGLRAKKQKQRRVETDEEENELFPAPDAFGVEIGDEEFSSLGGGVNVEEDEELEEILSGVNNDGTGQRRRKRRMFGPGLTAEEIKSVISSFTDEQMDRYETFRRANINRGGVKKLANAVLNQSITNTVAVAISGFSKVFLGEVIERALDVQQRMDPGDGVNPYAAQRPLLAVHIREAWRLYRQETGMVPAAQWRREGRGDGRMFR